MEKNDFKRNFLLPEIHLPQSNRNLPRLFRSRGGNVSRSLVGVRLGVSPVVLLHPSKPLAPPQEPNRGGLEAQLYVHQTKRQGGGGQGDRHERRTRENGERKQRVGERSGGGRVAGCQGVGGSISAVKLPTTNRSRRYLKRSRCMHIFPALYWTGQSCRT